MAAPYLADDESVVLAAENIRVGSVTYPALILTNRRVLLVRSEGDNISVEEYLLSRLRSALVSHAARDDPALILTYVTAKRESRRETFTFLGTPEKRRTDEVRQWAKKLSVNLKPLPDDEVILSESTTLAKHGGSAAGAGSHEILEKHGRLSGMSFPDIPDVSEPDEGSKFSAGRIILGAIIVVVIAAFAVMFLLPHGPSQEGSGPVPQTTPATPVPATTSTVSAVTSPARSPTPVEGQSKFWATGVWVHVQYSGKFTGNVGGGPTRKDVSDSGEKWYQQSVSSGPVVAIVEKMDSSNDKLTVDILKDGKVVEDGHGETTKPYGEVNIQIELVGVTPTPTP